MVSEEGKPEISVDTKKKENIGNIKNNGVRYAPKCNPTAVLDHDFPVFGLKLSCVSVRDLQLVYFQIDPLVDSKSNPASKVIQHSQVYFHVSILK